MLRWALAMRSRHGEAIDADGGCVAALVVEGVRIPRGSAGLGCWWWVSAREPCDLPCIACNGPKEHSIRRLAACDRALRRCGAAPAAGTGISQGDKIYARDGVAWATRGVQVRVARGPLWLSQLVCARCHDSDPCIGHLSSARNSRGPWAA